ncbi:YciI-like protein [Sporichthya brevicatena]|uniref:YciI-like protein n=1 Tax=Sporichthya brevicatena TaxID=171442 RepID=A0ABN1GY68_9ACTN
MTHVVLEYSLADTYLERRGEFRAAHLGLLEAAVERGELVLAGALADPYDRALLVWAEGSEDAIAAFVAADPYVANGLVTDWRIRTWNTVVGTALPAAGTP